MLYFIQYTINFILVYSIQEKTRYLPSTFYQKSSLSLILCKTCLMLFNEYNTVVIILILQRRNDNRLVVDISIRKQNVSYGLLLYTTQSKGLTGSKQGGRIFFFRCNFPVPVILLNFHVFFAFSVCHPLRKISFFILIF